MEYETGLRHFRVESLTHLSASMSEQHSAISIDVDKRPGLRKKKQDERKRYEKEYSYMSILAANALPYSKLQPTHTHTHTHTHMHTYTHTHTHKPHKFVFFCHPPDFPPHLPSLLPPPIPFITAWQQTPDIGFDWDKNAGMPFSYFCYGAACAEVEIDVLTGDSTLLRADIVMDVGASLNPAIDIGQVEGAFVQGCGLFMLEEVWFGPQGTLRTFGPGNYKIPGFKDIPIEMHVSLLRNAPNARAVHSSKAVGEVSGEKTRGKVNKRKK